MQRGGGNKPGYAKGEMGSSFTDKGENAIVETIVYYNSLNDLETVINIGMQEGMMSNFEKMDELLLILKK